MSFQKILLGDICDFIRGVSFNGTEATEMPTDDMVPILRAGNIGTILNTENDLIWVPSKRVSKEQYLQLNDIVICMASGSKDVLGKTAILTHKFRGSVGAFCGIIRSRKVDPKFIAYWLLSSGFYKWRDDQAKGANIQNLRYSEILDIPIPLPPLDEQRRIAALLQRADRLRRLRRFSRQLSDTFLQSVFLQMFGDPVTNPMGWETAQIADFASLISSGATPLGGAETYQKTGIRFIRSQNVLMNSFDFSDIVYIGNETHMNMKRTWVKENDILLNITGASIGRVAIYTEQVPANVNQHVCIIRIKPGILSPKYLSYQISIPSFQKYILSLQSGATRQAFNFEQIRDFRIIVPQMELQKDFISIAEKFLNNNSRLIESSRQSEQLFQTLLARAFSSSR